jgi:3-deoxy-7-phosphoheptulonate synthase
MNKTDDLRVLGYCKLIQPGVLKKEMPVSEKSIATVVAGREHVQNILSKKEKRMLVIVGPCSIHDEKASLEYAEKLNQLSKKVDQTLCIIMRVYFEKPRTTVGWKGLINDPQLDGSHNITDGLQKARNILMQITEMGMPTATEMLEMVTPQYVADLVSWAAIGARTTESQTHRELASGLSMPVGFKNGTDGVLTGAINAMVAARAPQSFLGIDQDGQTSIVKTSGNPWCHLVLRGGQWPNYDPVSIEDARLKLRGKDLPEVIMVDCSHANSGKKFQRQEHVWKDIVEQRLDGDDSLVGMMLESNLFEGSQRFTGEPSTLSYGVSITDECISLETTERLILSANERLAGRI